MTGNYNLPRFRVAAVQAGPVLRDKPHYFDLEATLNKAVDIIEEAGRNGARLIVFPECWIPCFPYWSLDFTDRADFIDIWSKFLWNSVEVPGPEIEALVAAAQRANAYVVMGINERDKKYPGRMYNSMVYLSPHGEVMGTHRKICNTVQERFFHTPGDGGNNLKTVFKTEIGVIGGSMCGEHTQLPLIFHWITQGIQIHCSLWPGRRGLERVTDIATRALSFSANSFQVLAATYIPEKDQPKNFYRNSLFNVPDGFAGGSGIINPFGEYVAGPVFDQETVVYADIDLADTDRSRYGVSLTGIYSRWDLININVREENYEPVIPMEATPIDSPVHDSERIKAMEAKIGQLEQQIAELASQSTGQKSEDTRQANTQLTH